MSTDHQPEKMDVYITRQPIFDADKRLHAYELLFCSVRKGEATVCGEGNRATTGILSSTFLSEGREKITADRTCYIPFTLELLLQGIATFFPNTRMVVGVPCEDPPDKRLISACEELVAQGYVLCLDDFIWHEACHPLLRLADVVRIDFSAVTPDGVEEILAKIRDQEVKLLADHLETYDAFHQAGRLGFEYFQGNFFCRPETMRVRELPSTQQNLASLLAELNRGETDVDRLDRIISTDVGISYKLLRYINSAHFYLVREVTSVRQAIQYLGVQEIRRFISLVIISELASDKPEELIRLSLVRARFCELLAAEVDPDTDTSRFFLLGLFSLLEALLDTSVAVIMQKLPLAEELKEALVDGKGDMFPYLKLVQLYEQGEFAESEQLLEEIGIDGESASFLYLEAVQFGAVLAQ